MLCNTLPTFPHEGSFIMVHYLCRHQSVIDHLVVSHAVEAAVLDTAAELVLRQGTLQEGAHLLNGAWQVLQQSVTHNKKIKPSNRTVLLKKHKYQPLPIINGIFRFNQL